jgi:predicted ArsR family transcriptional regulator
VIKLPSGQAVEETPLEARYKGVLCGLLTRIKLLYESLYEKYGNEGLELIREVSTRYGSQVAERARGEAEPWRLQQVGLYLVKVFDNMRAEGEVTEFSEHRVAIMVSCCPYPLERSEICAAHTAMECALVKGLNPSLDYRIEKSVPAGDSFCLHVLVAGDGKNGS